MSEIFNNNGLVGARSLDLWMPRVTSAESDLEWSRDIATGRARELAVSNAYVVNAKRTKRDNVVGPRFTLSLRPIAKLLGVSDQVAKEWAQTAESEWEAYAHSISFDCDAQRVQNFSGLIATAYEGTLTSGEALAMLKWKEGATGYRTCMLLIEPERLSNPPDRMKTTTMRNGVETDRDGAPIAYHIRQGHPGDGVYDQGLRSQKWIRVARHKPWGRPQILHLMERSRPDMRRGISAFAAILGTTKMLDGYDAAELEAAVLRSSFAAVIKTNLNSKDAMASIGAVAGLGMAPPGAGSDSMGGQALAQESLAYMSEIGKLAKENQMHLNGARVTQLLPNEELQLLQAGGEGLSYEAFTKAVVRKIAAGAGVTVEQLTRDFSEMTFAAAQMSLSEIWRHFLIERGRVIVQLALPFVGAFLEEAIETKRLTLPNGKQGTAEDWWPMASAVLAKSTFLSWGAPTVDPLKEANAAQVRLALGTTTLQREAQGRGDDWEEDARQRSAENALYEELDLPAAHELIPGQQPPEEPEPAKPAKK